MKETIHERHVILTKRVGQVNVSIGQSAGKPVCLQILKCRYLFSVLVNSVKKLL